MRFLWRCLFGPQPWWGGLLRLHPWGGERVMLRDSESSSQQREVAKVKEHLNHKTHYNSEHTNHLNQHLEARQQTQHKGLTCDGVHLCTDSNTTCSAADGLGLWLARLLLCRLDGEASVWLSTSGPTPENFQVYAFHLFNAYFWWVFWVTLIWFDLTLLVSERIGGGIGNAERKRVFDLMSFWCLLKRFHHIKPQTSHRMSSYISGLVFILNIHSSSTSWGCIWKCLCQTLVQLN